MDITILGGAEIGASCILCRTKEHAWLVDAGVRLETDPLPNLAWLEENKILVDGIFITHAHQDHVGALPLVSAMYPNAPVFMTQPTWDISRVMLVDALKLASSGVGQQVFTEEQLNGLQTRIRIIGQDRAFAWQGMRVTSYSVGHILGAVAYGFETPEGSVLFTGDISVSPGRLLNGMRLPHDTHYDTLVTETTYGNRLHANRAVQERELVEKVTRVIAAGGHVLIPAFAVGRAQEVLIILLEAMRYNPEIPKFPIVVDGLIRSICPIYESYPHLLNGPIKRKIHVEGRLFSPDHIQFIHNVRERKEVLSGPPCCIIASSGMLTGGPSVFYTSELAPHEKNAIILCGYQDEESPGRQLLDLASKPLGDRQWILPDRVVPIRCEVSFYSLSAHADRRELLLNIDKLKPTRVVLVHGDREAKEYIAGELNTSIFTVIPEVAETVECARGKTIWKGPVLSEGEVIAKIDESPGKVVLYQSDDLFKLAVCLKKDNNLLTVLTGQGITETVPADKVQEIFGPVPPGEEKVRYVARLWEAAQAKLAEGKIYGGQPAEKIAYIIAKNGGVLEQKTFVRLLEPYGHRKTKIDLASRTITVYLDFPWLLPDDVRVKVEESVKETGWKVRIANEIYPNALKRVILNTFTRTRRESLGIGSFQMFYNEKLVVVPIAGDFSEQEKAAWENEWSQAIGGKVIIKAVGRNNEGVPRKERMEQNEAIRKVKEMAPVSFGLVRVGADSASGVLKVFVKFPDAVRKKPGVIEWTEQMESETGWKLEWQNSVVQSELVRLAVDGLPATGFPSIMTNDKTVKVKLVKPVDEDILEERAKRFYEVTGWRLKFAESPVNNEGDEPVIKYGEKRGRLEINKALALIDTAARVENVPIYKKSYNNNRIELKFITPEVGRQWAAWVEKMSEKTGWQIAIADYVHQQALINFVIQLVGQDVLIKNPSIHQDSRTVSVQLKRNLLDNEKEKFKRLTGWDLVD